jgi:flagellar hook protein FlgE
MAISNSLNSGVTAVKAFGKSLEVIGDNIANVNTTGFKGSRVLNKDGFSQLIQKSVTDGAQTGSSTMQIGSGTAVASISQQFTQGVLSTTGGPTDLGISGKGFFQVKDSATGGTGEVFYTRAGDFRLNEDGLLVTSGGLRVQGTNGDITIPMAVGTASLQSFKISDNGEITPFYSDGTNGGGAKPVIKLASFADPNALERSGDNLLKNPGDTGTGAGSANGTVAANVTDNLKFGAIKQGTLELSNVDLTKEFSELIVAQRSFQAGARIITVSDSVLEEVVNLKR